MVVRVELSVRVSSTGDCGRLRRVTGFRQREIAGDCVALQGACELSVRGRSAGAFELRVASRVSSTGDQRVQTALSFVSGRFREITYSQHTHGPSAPPHVRSTAPHTRPQAPRMDPVWSPYAPRSAPSTGGRARSLNSPHTQDRHRRRTARGATQVVCRMPATRALTGVTACQVARTRARRQPPVGHESHGGHRRCTGAGSGLRASHASW